MGSLITNKKPETGHERRLEESVSGSSPSSENLNTKDSKPPWLIKKSAKKAGSSAQRGNVGRLRHVDSRQAKTGHCVAFDGKPGKGNSHLDPAARQAKR